MTSLRKTLPIAGLRTPMAFAAALILVAGLAPSARAAQLYAYSEQTISNLVFNPVTTNGGTISMGLPIYTSASSAAGPGSGSALTDTLDVPEAFTGASSVDPGQNVFAPVGIKPGLDYARGDALLSPGNTSNSFSTVAETSYAGSNSSAGNANYSIRMTFTVNSGTFTITPNLTYTNTLVETTGGAAAALARASYGFELSISSIVSGSQPFFDLKPGVLNNERIAQPDTTFSQGPTNLANTSFTTVGPGTYVLQIVSNTTVSTTQLVPVPPAATAVPEPATLISAAGAALFGLAYLRRTSRKIASA